MAEPPLPPKPANPEHVQPDRAQPERTQPGRKRRQPGSAGPAPSRVRLHDAALAYLGRFAATEAGLLRVLDRRIDRWARAAEAEGTLDPGSVAEARNAAREVAGALARSGVVDDAAFAGARARSLTRAGRSRLAVGAHLAAKGVPPDVAKAALPDPGTELAAALAYASRRRLGPFRAGGADDGRHRKELGALARAGFPQPVAQQALRMDPEEAKALVLRLKQG